MTNPKQDAPIAEDLRELYAARNKGGEGWDGLCICNLVKRVSKAEAEVQRLREELADPAKVHASILRGTIALTKEQAIHIAGLPADIAAIIAERDALKEQVRKLTQPVSDEEIMIVQDLREFYAWANEPGRESDLGPMNTWKRATKEMIERISKSETQVQKLTRAMETIADGTAFKQDADGFCTSDFSSTARDALDNARAK